MALPDPTPNSPAKFLVFWYSVMGGIGICGQFDNPTDAYVAAQFQNDNNDGSGDVVYYYVVEARYPATNTATLI